MTIASELLALRDKDGLLRVEKAHAWAKAHQKTSALGRALNWDDASAAENYRLWQIRHLIQVHIVDEDRHPRQISLRIDRGKGGGYRNIDDVMDVPDLREQALNDALDEHQRIKAKYDWLCELAEIHAAIDRVPRPGARTRRAA